MAAAFVLLAASCSSTSTGGGAGDACSSRSADAEATVQRTIDANLGCSVDSDCAVVDLAADCFDACTRAVSAGGVAAVTRSIDAVNAGTCATYVRDCGAVVHPPCAARATPPLCTLGHCQ